MFGGDDGDVIFDGFGGRRGVGVASAVNERWRKNGEGGGKELG